MNFTDYTIKEIKKILTGIKINKKIIKKLQQDNRQGVRNLGVKYKNILKREKERQQKWERMNKREDILHNRGYKLIAGIDEAGRGPLAGPVVAAAVILPGDKKIIGLDDSKKLSARKREKLYDIIKKLAVAVGVGIIDNKEIDKVNIQKATFLAMKTAVRNLDIIPDYLLIDGNKKIPSLSLKQETVIDGDAKVNVIAAASIIAKVTRDNIIDRYHEKYPQYGFINNKGYGTKEHIEAIKKYGVTPLHRLSYGIVNKHINNNAKKSGDINE